MAKHQMTHRELRDWADHEGGLFSLCHHGINLEDLDGIHPEIVKIVKRAMKVADLEMVFTALIEAAAALEPPLPDDEDELYA